MLLAISRLVASWLDFKRLYKIESIDFSSTWRRPSPVEMCHEQLSHHCLLMMRYCFFISFMD